MEATLVLPPKLMRQPEYREAKPLSAQLSPAADSFLSLSCQATQLRSGVPAHDRPGKRADRPLRSAEATILTKATSRQRAPSASRRTLK